MKTLTKPSPPHQPTLAQWSTFGASILAGLAAGVLWAPAAGSHSRTRLAAGFRDWSRTVAGLWTPWPLARRPHHGSAPATRRPTPDLAMQPNRLLTED